MIDRLHKIHNILHTNVYYAYQIKRRFHCGETVLFGGICAEIPDFITLLACSIALFGADTVPFRGNKCGKILFYIGDYADKVRNISVLLRYLLESCADVPHFIAD